jgi:hypothetical protein
LNPVARVSEPSSAVVLLDSIARASSDTNESVGGSGSALADVLLLECPSRFDGVEVRRIGGLVQEFDAHSSAGLGHARVMVSSEVVHDEDVAALKLRQQTLGEPIDEAISVRRREGDRQLHPPREPDGAHEREVLSPVHWAPVDVLLALRDPSMATAHREVQSRLVQEDQTLRGNSLDLLEELLPFQRDVGSQLLQRPEAYFL